MDRNRGHFFYLSKKGEFVHTNLNENQEKPLCFIDSLHNFAAQICSTLKSIKL